MIKKIITNTLLSVFMDKEGRESFNFYKKSRLKKKGLNKKSATLKDFLQDKLPPNKKKEKDISEGSKDISEIETHKIILQSLEAAKLEINSKKEMREKRQTLIEKTLKLQRSKGYVLNKLSEDQRQKLKVLALKVLNIETTPSESSKNKIPKNRK